MEFGSCIVAGGLGTDGCVLGLVFENVTSRATARAVNTLRPPHATQTLRLGAERGGALAMGGAC